MIVSMFAAVPFTASAAESTVTITAADFVGDNDIINGESTTVKGVVFRVIDGDIWIANTISFLLSSEHVISIVDGSLITSIVLSGDI